RRTNRPILRTRLLVKATRTSGRTAGCKSVIVLVRRRMHTTPQNAQRRTLKRRPLLLMPGSSGTQLTKQRWKPKKLRRPARKQVKQTPGVKQRNVRRRRQIADVKQPRLRRSRRKPTAAKRSSVRSVETAPVSATPAKPLARRPASTGRMLPAAVPVLNARTVRPKRQHRKLMNSAAAQ